jgi:hypothetical protein
VHWLKSQGGDELNSIVALISILEREKIPYKYYANDNEVIQSIFWVDPKLISEMEKRHIDNANIIVHDTTFWCFVIDYIRCGILT